MGPNSIGLVSLSEGKCQIRRDAQGECRVMTEAGMQLQAEDHGGQTDGLPQKLEGSREGLYQSLRGSVALLTHQFQTSSL